ncbi:MlaD family protein [Hoyosella subflava]|uniref:Putative Mce family protein n=1 Tax=Hoyosella subflava (strain DSM 45089 / JCM 17490 / NBRC 109087 / DQS3-9A1) TaxID=443218 RepID=F6EHS3_HOYSD|nr:MCE family protein [Hoyosella subflava]AEF38871.1 Putative Mce family protein [Hoyosella subflava DQS3-9A1]
MKLSKGALAGLVVFLVLVLFTSVSVWQTLSPPVDGRSATYTAEFDDATSLKRGDDVTLAGVRVGKVGGTAWERQSDGSVRAVVSFAIERDVELTENARAEVKFADMLGVRYLGLIDPGGAAALQRGDRLPTLGKPPTDVTELFNGFRPVFRLLDPPRLNQMSASLIGALEGNTDVFEAMLIGMLDVANVMLARQAEIERIANTLPDAFDVVIERRDDVEAAIEGLTALTENLASRNDDIIALLDQGGSTMDKFATLLDTTMPDLRRSVAAGIDVSEEWSQNTEEYRGLLESLLRTGEAVNHYGDYGSWLTLYICTLSVQVDDFEADLFNLIGGTHSEVCR